MTNQFDARDIRESQASRAALAPGLLCAIRQVRGLTPNGTHFSGAARAARFVEHQYLRFSPDSLRCSAIKASAIACVPPSLAG